MHSITAHGRPACLFSRVVAGVIILESRKSDNFSKIEYVPKLQTGVMRSKLDNLN